MNERIQTRNTCFPVLIGPKPILNCPLNCTFHIPLANIHFFSIALHFSSIDEADQSTIPLEEDDVIVLGSDGLFDNLSTQQIGREILQLKVTIFYSMKTINRTKE